ncbi:DUF4097 family beta strand repeat-containing protein [Radiobacillus sp. PE A8.2]|uniref:DUF4097 family beta strand repeat-containing protein n=1 Tax=Radiobacillus sp. PE A8.2 TaxID=3380349 RepID=UPI00389040CB
MKKVALFAFIFLIIGIIGMITFGDNVFSFSARDKSSLDEEKQVSAENVDDIVISVGVAEVSIEPSDDENIHVHLHGDISEKMRERLTFKVEENNDSLEITVNAKEFFNFSFSSLFSFNNGGLNLDVQLPEKLYTELNVSTDVGDISIDGISTEQFIASLDVGDLAVDDMTSKQTEIESNVGDVNIKDGVGAFDIETDTGEIGLAILEFREDISIQSDVGDVFVSLENEPENIVLDLQSDIGDIKVENLQGKNNSIGGDVYMEIGTGGPTLEVRTDVGEITVEQ